MAGGLELTTDLRELMTKKSPLRILSLFLLLLALLGFSPLPPGFDPAQTAVRQISFAGILWTVDAGSFQDGNTFSDAADAVWVDAQGLHLTLRKVNGVWYGSQVTSLSNAHYGPHRFQVIATKPTLDKIDPNVVLGLFLYKGCSRPDCVRELDHEFSRWNLPASPLNAQFVAQPSTVKGNRFQYTMALGDAAATTHVIDWHEHQVNFASYLGTDHNDPAHLLNAWAYTGAYIPIESDNPKIIIDLWVNDLDLGKVPASNLEVIIADVEISTLCRPIADLVCGATIQGSTDKALNSKARDQIDGYRDSTWPESGRETAYAFKPQSNGPVTFQLSNHSSDLDLFVIANNADNKCYSTNQNLTHGNEVASFNAVAGQTYYLVVDGWSETSSSFTLRTDCGLAAPPPDPTKVIFYNYFPTIRR